MSALPNPSLPDHLREEMVRLHRAGFSLLPLGGGDNGKSPRVADWARKHLSLSQSFGPMHRSGVAMYGIRLGGLVVVDLDADDAQLVADLEVRFGPSPVHVKTPRGRHLYYRANDALPNLRGENLPVDIKSGPTAYVAGPYSQRPDGGLYEPVKGALGLDALPTLNTQDCAPVAAMKRPARILEGDRHNELVKQAMKRVRHVSGHAELVADLGDIRDQWCECPVTMPDSELEGIASWAWKARLDNRLYDGRRSAFRVDRQALDLLRGEPAQEDALALYVRLLDQHGHTPGKKFPLCQKAMKKADLTALSRDRFLAARQLLESAGLLKKATNHKAGSRKQTFTLTMPIAEPEAENIKTIPCRGRGETGGGP